MKNFNVINSDEILYSQNICRDCELNPIHFQDPRVNRKCLKGKRGKRTESR
jgi:hypothetical protein